MTPSQLEGVFFDAESTGRTSAFDAYHQLMRLDRDARLLVIGFAFARYQESAFWSWALKDTTTKRSDIPTER